MYVLWKQFTYVNCSFDKVTDFLNNINLYEYVQYILFQMHVAYIRFWLLPTWWTVHMLLFVVSVYIYLFQCTVHLLVYEVPTEACAV